MLVSRGGTPPAHTHLEHTHTNPHHPPTHLEHAHTPTPIPTTHTHTHNPHPHPAKSEYENITIINAQKRAWFCIVASLACSGFFTWELYLADWKFEPMNLNPMYGPSTPVLIQAGAKDVRVLVRALASLPLIPPPPAHILPLSHPSPVSPNPEMLHAAPHTAPHTATHHPRAETSWSQSYAFASHPSLSRSLALSFSRSLALSLSLSLTPPQVPLIKAGEYWRLFTPMWLHAGLIHVAFNLLSLFSLGNALEQAFGWWKIALLYTLSGIFSTVVSCVFVPGQIMVGASGAIFGFIGANW